jgi:hypothetical protein
MGGELSFEDWFLEFLAIADSVGGFLECLLAQEDYIFTFYDYGYSPDVFFFEHFATNNNEVLQHTSKKT